MDSFSRTFHQFADLYRSMSPSQRGTLIAVPLMIVVAFGVVMVGERSSSYVALSWGKVFETAEVIDVEHALTEAGLTDYRREGRRIMVPKNAVDRYNGALAASGNLPADSASQLYKQFEQFSGPFTTQKQQEQFRDITLKEEIRRMLRGVSDIDDAEVIWARGQKPSSLFGSAKVTATLFVRPRRGQELSVALIESLRTAVANMVPDLESTDVTILDQSTGTSHTADKEGSPFDSRLLTRIKDFERAHHDKIAHALSSINDVLITVSVDLDNLQRFAETIQTFDQKKSAPLRTREQTNTVKSTQQVASAEPGQRSNTPQQISQSTGPVKVHETTESDTDTVNVPAYTTQERVYTAAMPKAVKITVSIPDDHYRAVAAKEGITEGATDQEKTAFKTQLAVIETAEISRVKNALQTLLPENSPPEAVNVETYVYLPRDTPALGPLPLTQTISRLGVQWGSAVALGLFTLWALWMLHKSLSRVPDAESPDTAAILSKLTRANEEVGEEKAPKELTRRDRLQSAVRDNPEMAASVLAKWIQTAN